MRHMARSMMGGGAFSPESPAMTSNTLPAGYTASSDDDFAGSYPAYKAFDGIEGGANFWGSANLPAYVQLQFPSARFCTAYQIVPRNVTSQSPKDWTFKGSNNGSSWTTLDTRTGQTVWADGVGVTYTISSPSAYLYYRLNVTANQGGGSAGTTAAVSELNFTFITG